MIDKRNTLWNTVQKINAIIDDNGMSYFESIKSVL